MDFIVETGPSTPHGWQMVDDAINHYGVENIHTIRGKWVPAMPSNLNKFNELISSGMSPEAAASQTFTGKQAARRGYTNIEVKRMVGEPGSYTDVEVTYRR